VVVIVGIVLIGLEDEEDTSLDLDCGVFMNVGVFDLESGGIVEGATHYGFRHFLLFVG